MISEFLQEIPGKGSLADTECGFFAINWSHPDPQIKRASSREPVLLRSSGYVFVLPRPG